jgi:DNA-binding ferritin-like protein
MKILFIQALELQNNLLGASRLAHWNSEGLDFYQFHLLFERIYGIVEEKVDLLAEQARGMRVEIPASIFNSVPELEWETCKDLAEFISNLNQEFKAGLIRLRKEADGAEEYGVVNVIEDILSDCNTIHYLLSSILDIL